MDQYLKNHPFWCISSLFCLGVFLSSFSERLLLLASIIGVIAFIVLLYIRKNISNSLFITASCFLFFIIGVFRYQIASPKYQSKHIENLSKKNFKQKVTLSIVEIFKASEKANNYKVKIHTIDNEKSKGYCLLSIPKETTHKNYQLGDAFIAYTKLKPLKNTGNPYTFEYSDYLKNKHITHKIWITAQQLYPIETLSNNWLQFSNKIRSHLQKRLKKQSLTPKVLQITEALVLGNKSTIDSELKSDFINAGVIHILAISGLHIGILYLLLNGIFGLVFSHSKNNVFIALSIILFLWSFAWFSGGSPSALRATTMFTCFQFSKLSLRPQHPINALFLSSLILVFIDPKIISSVGFQLSISAVAAIIIGVPRLFALWYPENWFARKVWSIICLSFCAQIGILPLSIYYFHQFSGLFLIANIPIMLVISLALTGAIFIVIFSSFTDLPLMIINIYNEFITAIINYVSWVAHFDQFVLKDRYINVYSLLFSYLFIFFLGYTYYNPRKAYKWGFPILSLGIIIGFWEYQQRIFKNELWLLNQYNNTVVIELTSNEAKIHSYNELNIKEIKHLIQPILGNLHYPELDISPLQNSYTYYDAHICIINNKNQIPKKDKNSIFILNNSPKINIERLIKNHTPKLIIATPKNYANTIEKWKATSSKEQAAFYAVSENGAINLTPLLNTLKK